MTEHSGRVAVGDRQVFFKILGDGEPTVIFEAGSECDSTALLALAQQVQSLTRSVVYDRAGMGQSDAAPQPRTVRHAVEDLEMLLERAQIPAPYLLVGHSYGGMIVRLFATRHIEQVVGLVLLDSPPPGLALRELALLPPQAADEPAALSEFRKQALLEWQDPFSNSEGIDWQASAAQMREVVHLGDLPLIVITAGIDEWDEGFPAEVMRALEDDWMQEQRALLALSRNGRQIIASESNHSIQDCQPELVVDVIRTLIEQARA